MAGFNKVKSVPTAITHEGGIAYNKTIFNNWLNMLFSSYLEEQYYESAAVQQERFLAATQEVADKYGISFVAKAALFTRQELGMRSISQLLAGWLNNQSFENKRAFFRSYMTRPDDVAEICAAIDMLENKRSHAFVRGAADYLKSLSAYALGKYKLNKRTYNMYDLINITHANSPVIDSFMRNELEAPDTWEVRISAISNETERAREWIRLFQDHKLGYIALLRNLNNLMKAIDIVGRYSLIAAEIVPALTNKDAIRKSKVFPYRFYVAYRNMTYSSLPIANALAEAFVIAIDNMPVLEGETGIILDVSGSMEEKISKKSDISLKEVGACYAAALMFKNPKTTHFIKFGSQAKIIDINRFNVFEAITDMARNDACGFGTFINPAFTLYKKKYGVPNRLFIISDMQVMEEPGFGNLDRFNLYTNADADTRSADESFVNNFGTIPAYSFDLANYSTQIIKPMRPNYHYITSLNDTIMRFIPFLEEGENAIVEYINTNFSF